MQEPRTHRRGPADLFTSGMLLVGASVAILVGALFLLLVAVVPVIFVNAMAFASVDLVLVPNVGP